MAGLQALNERQLRSLATSEGSLEFVAWVACVIAAAWAGVHLFLGNYDLGVLSVISAFFLLVSSLLLNRGRLRLAKHLFFIPLIVGLWVYMLIIPDVSLINLFNIGIATGAVLVFARRRERRMMVLYTGLSLIGLLAPYILPQQGYFPAAISEEFAEAYLRPFSVVTVFAAMVYLSFWFNAAVRSQITKLRHAQQEAQELAAAKADFLTVVSHEMRTPMNGIVGMVELVLLGKLDPEKRRMMSSVHDSAEELLRVIDDLVDASAIEKGHFVVRSEPTKIRDVIHHSAEAIRPRAESKNVQLQLHIEDNVPECILGDASRKQQVILNLLDNAVKFSEATADETSGIVNFSVSAFNAQELVMKISDHGIGMSQEMVDRLFLPFVQSEQVATRRYGGLGLGLSISQQLVKQLGGSIVVESEAGNGSTFIVRLPMIVIDVDGHEQQVRIPDASGRPYSSDQKILVVEDNKINRTVISQQLKTLGFQSEVAINGQEGLDMWRNGDFSLILSDCHMPEMDGFEMAKKIRKEERERHLSEIPIIAVTAGAKGQNEGSCLESGMNAMLVKPVTLDGLSAVLTEWAESEEAKTA